MVGSDKNIRIKEVISRMLLRAIETLPDADREIFILKHYKNMNADAISRRLRMPVWEVERSLHRSSRWLLCQMHPCRREISLDR